VPSGAAVAEGHADLYVVIVGYKRIAALERLSRDTLPESMSPGAFANRTGSAAWRFLLSVGARSCARMGILCRS
jgi:hypothetical protein